MSGTSRQVGVSAPDESDGVVAAALDDTAEQQPVTEFVFVPNSEPEPIDDAEVEDELGPEPEVIDAEPDTHEMAAPEMDAPEEVAPEAAAPEPQAPSAAISEAPVAPDPVEPPEPPPAPIVLSGPPSERLRQLGIDLPAVAPPAGDYVPSVRTGNLVFTSGQLPMIDGSLQLTGVVGDESVDISVAQARALARICAVNALAAIAVHTDLDQVSRIVKVVGFVASAPGFTQQPAVIDGASELFGQLWGEAGRHARSAVGVIALPRNAPVEVEVVVELASEPASASS